MRKWMRRFRVKDKGWKEGMMGKDLCWDVA